MLQQGKILIVDDDQDILLSLRLFLKKHFTSVVTEHNPHHIPRLLRQHDFDLVLLDLNFRRQDQAGDEGNFWLKKMLSLQPQLGIIMITAYASVPAAVRAVKNGALDFVEKPWRNEELLKTLQNALQLSTSKAKQKQVEKGSQTATIIGESPLLKQVLSNAEKVAYTDANVLILGENGTGKELLARFLHERSKRSGEVFVKVDLGSISDGLFASELFGHVKGAFTDAKMDRVGYFESAKGGTLFFDEIGNLSLPLQAKLLQAIQERQIRKVGSNDLIDLDIRLVCATNMPLAQMVEAGRFRQDLLYRMNTIELELPPLRKRPEDIPLLAKHFLELYIEKYEKVDLQLSTAAYEKLSAFTWPGNVRELQHAVERAVILSETTVITPNDFKWRMSNRTAANQLFSSYNLEDMEKQLVEKALQKNQGNISKAAKALGITRAALYRRMEKYKL
ncbi:MAG: sigma-54-dependent transcriptional regulator [Saprospiraceae bacterium]